MPSSDINMVPKVVSLVTSIFPKSVLDVGVGNGRYGFLFRECLDMNYGRMLKDSWEFVIDGVEAEESYITEVHRYCYNDIIISDWLKYIPERKYDLIFMGDVLEHWQDGEWQNALNKARAKSALTIVVSPNWKGSIAQGAWEGNERERHRVVLSPELVGGRCLYANSKMFMCGFDNFGLGVFDSKDICL